jgi:hypothetical protein
MKLPIPAKVILTFIAFTAFLFMSNEFDWDHFFATNEADLQSWLLHHELPLWSNQICAGVTRLGDPQAFGLSPLFLPVLLFGSYFGLKVLVLLLMALGFWSLRTIGRFALRNFDGDKTVTLELLDLICLGTLFGNYLLWHTHHGHLTFFQIPLVLAMIALMLSIPDGRSSKLKHYFALFLLSWTYFSGGFYHSIVFFAFPLSLAVIVTLAVLLFTSHRQAVLLFIDSKKWGVLSLLFGLIAGGYKIWGVLAYQKLFPRTLAGPVEPSITWETLIYQFIPTLNYRFVGVNFQPGPWAIWEYSAFSVTAWIGLATLVSVIFRHFRKQTSSNFIASADSTKSLFIAALIVLLFAIWFSIGPHPFSIHAWLNIALKGSIRVVGRYQFLFSVGFFLIALIGIQNVDWIRKYLSKFGWIVVGLVILNMTTFSTLSLASFFIVRNIPNGVAEKMQQVGVVPFRDNSHSYMLPAISAGFLVPNCYNPINRQILIAGEFKGRPELSANGTTQLSPGRVVPLVRNTTSETCLQETYVTSNQIHLSENCGPGTCLNLNAVNVHSAPHPRLELDSNLRLLCVPQRQQTEHQ